jgi:hypothetical protein
MENRLKTKFLVEMFSAFPSFKTNDDQFKTTLASYLQALQGYPPEIVSEASLKARTKGGAWPPSAPEFYELCNQTAARRFQRDTLAQLPPPVDQFSDEHREAMKARFTKLVDDLKHGRLPPARHGFTDAQLDDPNCIVNRKGQVPYTTRPGPPFGFQTVHAPYGFLTPAELAQPSVTMPAKRTTPPSWLEKWEREHGRRYGSAPSRGDFSSRYGEAAE